jgi:hypothetical protein
MHPAVAEFAALKVWCLEKQGNKGTGEKKLSATLPSSNFAE